MFAHGEAEQTDNIINMKRLLLCTWTWVLLVLMGSGRSIGGCLGEERNALFKIKAAIQTGYGYSFYDWSNGHGDCCGWTGVKCDNTTSRVIQLNLSGWKVKGLYIDRKPARPLFIHASLFLPLEELQLLNLHHNFLSDLNGTLHLKKLKRLDLSDNDLQRVPSLYKQTSVEAQNLSSSQLEGMNLEELDLSYNFLVNDALADIMRITSLKALNISHCGLDAYSKLLEGLCRLRNLEELDISRNELWGPLPSCFCNMTSLRVLNIEDNGFSEAIPLSILSNLKSLEFINFSGNAFEGSLSLASLANNSKLETFSLIDSQNRLEVNTEDPTWFPSLRLKVFMLSNCVLNKDANGVIPSFLKEQYNLRFVQLNHNGMTGNFPKWLLDNNVNLEWLELRGNNLSGAFYLPSNLNPISMWWLDVSANIIDGELPSQIGFIFRNLIGFNMSNNHLKGEIPSSMGNMNQLSSLDLSNNGFIGEIPETLTKNCTALSILKLSGNILQGQMLPRNSSLKNLRILDLASNRFTGDLSPDILNSSLKVLDVSNNSLSGTLPHWIEDLHLQVLILSSNLFRGPLPSSFCNIQELFFLDLSSNNLGPSTPLCANVTYLRFLHLTNDMLVGHFPKFLLGASWIVTLDLRHNALSGEIPSWISTLRNLQFLLLQGNNFEGLIPRDLCLLENMSILDLSNNNVSGQIPSCLNKLRFHQDESCMVCDALYPGPVTLTHDISAFAFEFEEVKFMTKRRMESYKGYILKLMSGMDLSRNNLTGFIPSNFGNLSELRALNLSHNHLTGPIPKTFSNLKEVESLDLSYNNLNGPIPPQLIELYTLSTFRVAYNNLSGKTPDLKYQFGTFGEESYEGNPLLCGPPLTSCDGPNPRQGTPQSFNHTREDDSWREVFLWSFAGSYVVVFLGVVLFLYLNSYYQEVLFELVRKLIPSFP